MGMILTRRYNIDRFGYLIPHRYGNLPVLGSVATFRPGEGKFGRGAVAVEEGTTNLWNNRDNKTRTWRRNEGSWITFVSDNEILVDFTVEGPTTDSLHYYPSLNGVSEGPYTFSVEYEVYEFHTTASKANGFFLYIYDASGNLLGQSEILQPKPGERGRLHVTVNNPAENTSFSRVAIWWGPNMAVGDRVRMRVFNFQIEAKPFPTSFVDGTRAAGRLSYPVNFNMDEGTIRCYFYLNKTAVINAPTSFPSIFLAGQGTGTRNWFWVYFNEPRTLLRFQRRTDSGSTSGGMVDLSHFDELSDGWHDVAIVWDHASGVIRAFLDGEFKGTATYDKNDLIPFDRIDVGYRQGITGASNLLFDELLILPYAASEEEIRAWYEADGPIPPHPAALLQWDWQAVRPATMVAL